MPIYVYKIILMYGGRISLKIIIFSTCIISFMVINFLQVYIAVTLLAYVAAGLLMGSIMVLYMYGSDAIINCLVIINLNG